MGIRFSTTNTWRAPLKLIDSWLPAPTFEQPAKFNPKIVQMFTRAAWLARCTTDAGTSANKTNNHQVLLAPRSHRVRVVRKIDASASFCNDARLVISGHINDVCAELDRLAALDM